MCIKKNYTIIKASYWGFNEIVKLLLIENACVDVKDNYGTTPLDIGLSKKKRFYTKKNN